MTRKLFLTTQNPSTIHVRGTDARDFLHRMSTNEVIHRDPGETFFNCFTNEKGRMIAFVQHLPSTSKAECILEIAPEHAQKLVNYLDGFLFAEDVTLEPPPSPRVPGPAPTGIHPSEFQQHRINNNIPAANHEITDAYNPLELGLKDCIAFNKGCYVGQEVIARLDTYDKVSRELRPFKASQSEFAELQLGSKYSSNGKSGIITSLAPTYDPTGHQGLAIFSLKKSK